MARKIEDGERIDVPPIRMPSSASSGVTPAVVAANALAAGGKASTATRGSGDKLRNPGEGTVNINSADIAGLQRLPGVGPSTAQKIIDYRSQIRRFSSAEQLMDVKGIGPKKYEKMKPFVSL